MTPDQAAHAILRGEYGVDAAEVWITWRQQHHTPLIMDRLCAWLVGRVKELEATRDPVPRGTDSERYVSPAALRIAAEHLRTNITYLERNSERLIHRCGHHDSTIHTQAAQELRHAIHLVFSDALTLLEKFAL